MEDSRPELRIGDRERRSADDRLQGALADGVLDLSEYDERAARCWAARTRGDLDRLPADLPATSTAAPPARDPTAGPPVPALSTEPRCLGWGARPRRHRLVGLLLVSAAVVLGART